MDEIAFPFLRAQRYSFGELRAFEARLLNVRGQDQILSANLRSNRIPWAKIRNEELVPTRLLADHKRFADNDQFELMPEGNPTDIQVYTGQHKARYQITLAYQEWDSSPQGSSGGYRDHLRRERLRCGQAAFGGKNTRKENGAIVSEPHARDVRDDIEACQCGLIKAIKRKQAHDGTGCTLLIYAREYRFLLIDVDLTELIPHAVCQAGLNRFERVCVADEKFFWESG